MTLGRRIAEARKRAKLSQGTLGALVGVGQSAVANWESPTSDKPNEPSLAVIKKIAEATGADLVWLAWGESATPKDEVELLSIYRRLNDRDKAAVRAVARSYVDTTEDVASPFTGAA